MKQIRFMGGLRLLAGGLLWLLALGALAAQIQIGDLYYILNETDKTAEVVSDGWDGVKYTGEIVIPATVDYDGTTYAVTSIFESAFGGCMGLTSVTIPNSVTEIGPGAFYGCTGLTSVALPDALTSIGHSAFENCTGLTSIEIPALVSEISSGTFSGCTGLTSVALPDALTSIGHSAFENCTSLISIDIPEFVTEINSWTFSGCTGLTSVTIPNAVTSIGSSVFEGCTGLTSITIGNSVTEIGRDAFRDCIGLTFVTIPNSVTSIGECTFYGCTGLTSVEIPASLTEIGDYAFGGCTHLGAIHVDERNTTYCSVDGVLYNKDKTRLLVCPGGKKGAVSIPASVTSIYYDAFSLCAGLTSIEIPTSVTEIGDFAFEGCTGLTSIGIPASVDTVGDYAFGGCANLVAIQVDESNATYCSVDGVLYNKNKTRLLAWPGGKTGDVNILASVTSIGAGAFGLCTNLTSIEIPLSVTEIGDDAFVGCTGLTSIEIPDSVTSIGEEAFFRCTGLKTVVLGKSLAYIAAWAFEDCINLISLTAKAVVPAECGENVFLGVSKRQCELIVLKASVERYKNAPGWEDFTRITGKDLSDRIDVTALQIEPDQASLRAGESLQLKAVVTPVNATNKTVTWSSSDKKVATVDNDGYVVALAAGTVVITARTTDGSELSATCTITVTAAGSGGGNTAVEVPDALKAVRVYAADGHIEVRGLPLGTAVTLSGVDGRLYYQTEAVTGPELTLSAPRGHVYVLRLNHTHSLKVYLP